MPPSRTRWPAAVLSLLFALLFVASCSRASRPEPKPDPPPAPHNRSVAKDPVTPQAPAADPEAVILAFAGDQGTGNNPRAVYRTALKHGAQAFVALGDFGYGGGPEGWGEDINAELGPRYPLFAVIGNHDRARWNDYQPIIKQHIPAEARCSGEIGRNFACSYRGVGLVFSDVANGSDAQEGAAYVQQALASNADPWKVCAWHEQQHQMQVGGKSDATGWGVYQACADAGALVTNGHEHSYSRTFTLTDVGNSGAHHGMAGEFDAIALRPGSTCVVCNGLGGVGSRILLQSFPWMASYYTQDAHQVNGQPGSAALGRYAVLVVTFNARGDKHRAVAELRNTEDQIVDEFTIVRR